MSTGFDGRRVTGWSVLAAGVAALAVGAVLLVRPAAGPADAGELPPPPAATSPSARPATASAAPRRPAYWTPSRVRVEHLRVDAPVQASGVRRDGSLSVPDDPARLGWWIGSARPGTDRGTVLIAGHVDTARDGKGALFALETLPMGSRVQVRAGERTVTYRVTARRTYDKTRLPADLFRRDTPPRLALVTCGGVFRDGAYERNVVVYATPAR